MPQAFPKKNYATEAAMDDKNSLPRARSKKPWLPRSREKQNKYTRAMPTGQYWVTQLKRFVKLRQIVSDLILLSFTTEGCMCSTGNLTIDGGNDNATNKNLIGSTWQNKRAP